jgi:hypothetical protein
MATIGLKKLKIDRTLGTITLEATRWWYTTARSMEGIAHIPGNLVRSKSISLVEDENIVS